LEAVYCKKLKLKNERGLMVNGRAGNWRVRGEATEPFRHCPPECRRQQSQKMREGQKIPALLKPSQKCRSSPDGSNLTKRVCDQKQLN